MNKHTPKPLSVWKTGVPLSLGILGIFAMLLTLVNLSVRSRIHKEIENRDARAIHALAQHELDRTRSELGYPEGEPDINDFILWEALLATSSYPGILGIQLYSGNGEHLDSVPNGFRGSQISPEVLEETGMLEPASRFLGEQPPENHFANPEIEGPMPLLEVAIPLNFEDSEDLLGIARFLIDGGEIRNSFASVDKRLIQQGVIFFLIGGGILILLLLFGFYRLNRAQSQINERTRALIRANTDLSLAVKTNAVGSIAAHLLHDLKNPLSGLRMFVNNASRTQGEKLDPGELDYAMSATRKMEDLVKEISEVLLDEKQNTPYQITLRELKEAITHKVAPAAEENGAVFLCDEAPEGALDSSRANLLLLILYNLIQNAIEVTPPSLAVILEISRDGDGVTFEVADHGPGIPPERRDKIFEPGHSNKAKGTGLGLAISRQLAYHIGADLKLAHTDHSGSRFRIYLDMKTTLAPAPAATQKIEKKIHV